MCWVMCFKTFNCSFGAAPATWAMGFRLRTQAVPKLRHPPPSAGQVRPRGWDSRCSPSATGQTPASLPESRIHWVIAGNPSQKDIARTKHQHEYEQVDTGLSGSINHENDLGVGQSWVLKLGFLFSGSGPGSETLTKTYGSV